jgi:hypothetical protein
VISPPPKPLVPHGSIGGGVVVGSNRGQGHSPNFALQAPCQPPRTMPEARRHREARTFYRRTTHNARRSSVDKARAGASEGLGEQRRRSTVCSGAVQPLAPRRSVTELPPSFPNQTSRRLPIAPDGRGQAASGVERADALAYRQRTGNAAPRATRPHPGQPMPCRPIANGDLVARAKRGGSGSPKMGKFKS